MNIYRLKVTLLGVPPWATDKTVWRTIEMKGNQTLEQLHKAIFKAVDRFDEPDGTYLHQILQRLAPGGEPPRQAAHER